MLRTDDLDYDLPPDLIAVEPVTPRDAARLLVVSRGDPSRIEHRTVRDLPELLEADDLLVLNRSRVVPARFLGHREDTGGKVEGLYLRDGGEPGTWEIMLKARRFKPGAPIRLHTPAGEDSPVVLRLIERAGPDEPGAWIASVEHRTDHGGDVAEALDAVGLTPLPPYILAARRSREQDELLPADPDRYQTVYAKEAGSVAAPTAGLHFTPELLDRLEAAGVSRAEVLLHVGSGTFKPVETSTVEAHPMHAERCSLGPGVRERIEAAGRVIAVGTTSVRTLESFAPLPPQRDGDWIDTSLLITPGHPWRWADGLLTNFHLPRSTLLALVAALLDDPADSNPQAAAARLLDLYREAIDRRYRFYSFGDAMLVLP